MKSLQTTMVGFRALRVMRLKIASAFPDWLVESLFMTKELMYIPRIKKPRSFNEKVAHRKLYNNSSLYVELSDKFQAKKWAEKKIGKKYIIKTIQCVEKFDKLNVSDLPRQFVIKATHDSGSTVLVENKDHVCWDDLKVFFSRKLNDTYGKITYEGWYANISPMIMIEERLEDNVYLSPVDYKFFCFHGKVRLVQVDVDRFNNHTRNLYFPDWSPIDGRLAYPRGPCAPKPSRLAEMVDIAEKLSSEFDFVRVDLYCLSTGDIYFGEMTFAPGAGRERFTPRKLDFQLGEWW